MRLMASIGSRFPAAPTAVGNALLTTLSDTEIAARFTGPQHFPRRTERSVQTLDGLLRKVRLARTRGYAIDDNEVHPGIYGVAVVLSPWASGDPPLAMGASLMSVQASEEFVSSIVAELQSAVEHLSNPVVRGPSTEKSVQPVELIQLLIPFSNFQTPSVEQCSGRLTQRRSPYQGSAYTTCQ